MEKITEVSLMQKLEKDYINNDLNTSIGLMDKAALGIFNNVLWKGNIAIVCGKGNNGGDGFALACHLLNNGFSPDVIIFDEKTTPASGYFFSMLKERKADIITYQADFSFDKYDIIADCIFGIGFKGDVNGDYKEAIMKINNSKAFVVSADINSGLNADNGITSLAVRSSLTIAINNYKPGHFLNMAKDYIKELKYVDIGIPVVTDSCLLTKEDIKPFLKDRKNYSNKGNYGRVAILGGSGNYPGAIKLANLGQTAIYSGAGLTSVIVPENIADKLYPYVLEATIQKLPSDDNTFLFDKEKLDEALNKINALAIGVGLSKSEDTKKIISYILDNYDIPVIIDADGLNNLCDIGTDILNTTKCQVILTPHIVEFSRLIHKSLKEINENYLGFVREFVNKYNVTLLLKGPATIVADKDNIYYINKGCAGMASAGSGDVLTGIMCAMLGYLSEGSITMKAAIAAYVNGCAGELAQEKYCDISMTSGDTARNVSLAIKYLKE